MVFSALFDKSKEITKQPPRAGNVRRQEKAKVLKANHHGKEMTQHYLANKRNKLKARSEKRKGPLLPENDAEKRSRPAKKKRTRPSEEALALSEKLKELSRDKNLSESLRIFRDPCNKNVRDGHHACIIIDCCARCGDILEGEKIVNELLAAKEHVSVEIKTALLKGYAHSGKIVKAAALFESMCNARSRGDRPNVRSLNTLLRGCLWSAAYADSNGVVTGGVITSERAWILCRKIQEKDPKSILFDISSYEYSISLLAQALRTDDAEQRLQEMKVTFNTDKKPENMSQSVGESLALSYLALARAYAGKGEKSCALTACANALRYSKASRASLTNGSSSLPSKYASKQGKEPKGDKRAESNRLYRCHRLNEVERETKVIRELCTQGELASDPRQLARRLVTRLMVLSGGGTTDASGLKNPDSTKTESVGARTIQGRFLNTLFFSYGLQEILKKIKDVSLGDTSFLNRRDCNRILGSIGLQGGIVLEDGALNLKRIFTAGIGVDKGRRRRSLKELDLEIELGSGFGDWIVQKAQNNPSQQFLSVELRADRVGQTFARTALLAGISPVDNLCIVGGESGSFLTDYVAGDSVSAIYINHPEPPTQTFGATSLNLHSIMEGGEEPAHMISSTMITAAAKCLSKEKSGRLVIVTDNKWYGRLICATIVKTMKREPGLLYPVKLDKQYHELENFTFDNGTTKSASGVALYEGQPDDTIGHSKKFNGTGSTYFDRLWRSGAGSHAETTARFVVIVGRQKECKTS